MAIVACIFAPSTHLPVLADVITGTPGDDVITVTSGMDCDGVTTDGGNDTVTVEAGAEVRTEVADSGETAAAAGTAVDVGEGTNSVGNFGLIRTLAEALASIIDVLGSAAATADAEATGVLAADGVNTITNNDTIDVDASAETAAANVSLGGLSPSEADVTATATSVGVEVGDGTNTIDNESLIDVDASSSFSASGITVGLVGEESATAEIVAEASSTGIAGGDGEADAITNDGAVYASAETSGAASGVTVSLAGTAPASASSTATAHATGIDGGGGDDSILNLGEIGATATSAVSVAGVSVQSAGIGDSEADVTSTAIAVGIDGGEGADTIDNAGLMGVGASSSVAAAGVAVEIVVAATADASITSTAEATGIAGGGDTDTIDNTGMMEVSSEASGTSAGVAVNLLGGAAAEASITSEADAVGISGGDGDDVIDSSFLAVSAASHTTSANVGVDVQAVPIGGAVGVAYTNTVAEAISNAVGIDGGSGTDTVSTTGLTVVGAASEVDSASVSVNVGDASVGLVTGGAIAAAGSTATATATGVVGAEDITNSGGLNVTALSDIDSASVGVNVQGAIAGLSLGGALADTSSDATAVSLGLSGSDTDDIISNSGSIAADSDALVDSASVSVAVGSTLLGIQGQAPFANVTNTAEASATGIDGGAGDDQIDNTGTINADAYSWLDATSVSVDATFGIGVGVGAAFTDASGTSTTTAVGIASGEGGDTITSTGAVSAKSASTNLAGSNSFTITTTGGASIADGTTTTDAVALGISTGGGGDWVVSEDAILAEADAHGEAASLGVNAEGYVDADASAVVTSDSTGVDLGAGDDYFWNKSTITADSSECVAATGTTGVDLIGATFARADTTAHAIAAGVRAGEGIDTVVSDGALDVKAESWVYAESVSSSFLAGYSEASAALRAEADAVGIDGGAGGDYIRSTETTTVLGKSEAWADSYTVSLLSAGNSDTGITGDSNARGISGGEGGDTIYNEGALNVTAESFNDYSIGNPTLGGIVSANYQFFGYAEADTSVTMLSDAVGIDAGAGDDYVQSTEKITVRGKSTANAANLIVELAGAAFSESNVTADADATGISGGEGNDTLLNDGEIDIRADALMPEDSISKTWNGFAGYASAEASTIGTANAVGVDGGAGNDFIQSTNTIKVRSKTDGSAGVANLLAGIDVSQFTSDFVAETFATGISGGDGVDTIISEGALDIRADSLGESSSRGVLRFFGYMDASTTTDVTADAIGIDGGADGDFIQSTNTVTVTGYAKGNANNYTLDLSGAKIYEAATTVHSAAKGIYGNDGNDTILSGGAIEVTAQSITEDRGESAPPFSLNVLGYADADATTNVSADASGIDGGSGNDQIENTSTVSVSSTTDTVAPNTIINLIGGALGEAGITAEALATGIQGGEGNDTVWNEGALTINAESSGDASAVTVELLGYSDADATSTGTANAVGIDGGDGDDGITNQAVITVTSTAGATAASTVVDLVGGSTGEAGTTTHALATGIKGGDGSDVIDNESSVDAHVTATVDASGTTVLLAGYAPATAELTAEARSTGISGGDGDLDVIGNTDTITVLSEAFGTAGGVSVNLAGAAPVSVSTAAEAYATGIDGGGGDDWILNQGAIDVDAISDVSSEAVTVELAGYGDADAAVTAQAAAMGIDGGDGSDVIDNESSVDVHALATMDASGITVGLTGYAPAGADISAETEATGIAGGDGALDLITNTDTITVLSEAYGTAGGVTVNLAGAAPASVSTAAEAYAMGIDGGGGDDGILNQGIIDVDAVSDVSSGAVTVEIAGYGDSDASVTGKAVAVGIDGGDGSDTIENENTVDVHAVSTTDASGITVGLIGYAPAGAEISALAEAIGIAGGDGDLDIITNTSTETLSVLSEAYGTAGGVSVNLAGAAPVSISTKAVARATGITGEGGTDLVFNEGQMTVNAKADLDVESKTVSIAGASSDDVDTHVEAEATGIDGGDGDDEILNTGTITVGPGSDQGDPMADVYAYSSSWTGLGAGSAAATLTATSWSTGIDGGSGSDIIENEGALNVIAKSKTETDGSSWVFGGAASTDAVLKAVAEAAGILGGGEDDFISNSCLVDVHAIAETSSNAAGFSFVGTVSSQAMIAASAESMGIDGGAGADQILNEGTVTVDATANATAGGGAASAFTGADAAATVSAETAATGISGGSGSDTLVNSEVGAVDVTANANSEAYSGAEAGALFSDSKTRSAATSTTIGYGLHAGEGSNGVLNEGTITVEVTGAAEATALSDSNILSDIFGIDTDAFAMSEASLEDAEAIGIVAGDGVNQIESYGVVTVTLDPSVTALSIADSGAIVSGDGTAEASAAADGVQAMGICVGDGNNFIVSGTTTVTAQPHVDADSVSDADGIGEFREPDSRATSTVSADDTLAVGIKAGNGYNEIHNQGALSVTSAPDADEANAYAHYGEDWLGIDSFAYATATANGAQAIGIWSGDGGNLIWNSETGSITVNASPRADADSYAAGVGFDGDASASAVAHADNALAVGILTGAGDDWIINDGVIDVTAAPSASATAVASPSGNVLNAGEIEFYEETATAANAQAIGVSTGAGEDVIVNSGTITTYINDDAGARSGVGITSGSGNDEVYLIDDSQVEGSVELGTGDDSLTFAGTAQIIGILRGDLGLDSVIIDDTGSFILSDVAGIEWFKVNEGSLEVEHSYQLVNEGGVVAQINGDGTHGQLVIDGDFGLDGTLEVTRGPWAFVDGTTFDIISADVLNDAFDLEILPLPTVLLSFQTHQFSDLLQVEALAESFTIVATNPVEMILAKYLDEILPGATGDLSLVLGQFQILDESEFGEAFSSLSPDSYDNSTRTVLENIEQYLGLLRHRMRGLRSGGTSSGTQARARFKPVLLAYNGPDASELLNATQEEARKRTGIWAEGFAERGQADVDDGWTGFEYRTGGLSLGFDYALTDNLLAGAGAIFTGTEIDHDDDAGEGAVQSKGLSFYGSYSPEPMYVEAGFSYAAQEYDNERKVVVGPIQRTAVSDHDGDAFSVFAGVGLEREIRKWTVMPFASLEYICLDEDGYEESGADSLNLIVDSRQTQSLVSELGLSVGRVFEVKQGKVVPEVRGAWNYDFGIDDRDITASFEGSPGASFTIEGQDAGEHGLTVGAGISFLHKGGWGVGLKSDGEFREDYSAGGVAGEFRFTF